MIDNMNYYGVSAKMGLQFEILIEVIQDIAGEED